jgi:cell division protein FtsI (penicillin-binding protein 3)
MHKKGALLNPWAVCGLSLCLATGFCFVAMQFYKLQIIQHKQWAKKADQQQQQKIDLGAKRGTIFTKVDSLDKQDFVPLALDAPSFHLYVDSSSIPFVYKKELSTILAPLIEKDQNLIYDELSKKSRFRKLQWHLDIDQKKNIEKVFKKYIKKKPIPKNALFFLSGYKRVYPMGSLAGSLIHTLGTQEGLRGPERIPSGGLEKKLDSFLKGTHGQLIVNRTPKGRLDGAKIAIKPQQGSDVYLTIHPVIQTLVESELKEAVMKARAKGGWAIMMEPYTGEIMAFAQVPCIDLNDPSAIHVDPIKSTFSNLKALTDPFEPGSIIKPLTMLTCLKANRVLKSQGKAACFDPEEKVGCLNGMFPGRKNPIKDVHAYSFLNMDMALQKSSNVYMAKAISKVIQSLGDKFYSEELKQTFDLGKKTGLGIGVESSGFIPTPDKKTTSGRLEWSMPTPYSLSMGYNLLATSLQMTKAFAMIANGGKEVTPYIIQKIVKKSHDGPDEILFDSASCPRRDVQKIHPDDVKRITHAMQFAVNKGGTAFRAKIPGYTACGKTATTEKLVGGSYSKEKHISTFVGFAPMQEPKFVFLIVIDEPEKFYIEVVGKNQYGGVCTAPTFSTVGQKTLEILGVPPDDPKSLTDPKESKTFLDLKKLEDLFKQWNH